MKQIRTVEDVREILYIDASPYEWKLVAEYLEFGTRPDPMGCWHCLEARARRITGWIDFYHEHGLKPMGEI